MFVFGFRITFVCKSYFYNRPLNCLCQQKNVVLFTTKIKVVEQRFLRIIKKYFLKIVDNFYGQNFAKIGAIRLKRFAAVDAIIECRKRQINDKKR